MTRFLRYLYYSAIFLMVCSTMHVSFTWGWSQYAIIGIATVCTILFMSSNSKEFTLSKNKVRILVFIAIWYLYDGLASPNILYGLLNSTALFVCCSSIVLSSVEIKKQLLSFITVATAIMLLVSIVGWIMFLLNVPLLYTTDVGYDDNFHTWRNYYLFVMADLNYTIIPRFCGMFVEPGQLASVCVILLFSQKFDRNRLWCRIILIVSVILSFSLAGWLVYFIGSILTALIIKGKNRILNVVLIIAAVYGFALASRSDDSAIDTYIINRLAYNEETVIEGYNRTNSDFDSRYNSFIHSNDKFFGVKNRLANDNWTVSSSGIKKCIVVYGIIGTLIMLLMFCSIIYLNRSKQGLVLFVVYLCLFFVRTLGTSPYWLYPFILAIFIMRFQSQNTSYANQQR